MDHLDEKKKGTIQHATTIKLLPSSLAIVCPWYGYGSPQRAAPSVHPLIHTLQCTRAFPPSARGQCHHVWSKASLGPRTLRAYERLNIHTVASTWSVHVQVSKQSCDENSICNRLSTLKILALSRTWISSSESTKWIATTEDWESLGATREPVVGWRIREVRKSSRRVQRLPSQKPESRQRWISRNWLEEKQTSKGFKKKQLGWKKKTMAKTCLNNFPGLKKLRNWKLIPKWTEPQKRALHLQILAMKDKEGK